MMSIKQVILALVFTVSTMISYGQFNKQWVSGGNWPFKIDFNVSPPYVDIFVDTPSFIYCNLGQSNICDSTGKLILFCDGYNIYDSLGNFIEDGDSLASKELYIDDDGWSSYSQGSIFLPMGSNQYYLITQNATDSVYLSFFTPYNPAAFDELLLHKIDMNANGGLGKKYSTVKLLEHDSIRKVMMTACRHANGKDWWLVKQMWEWSGNYEGLHKLSKNKIAIFRISSDSVYSPFIQYFPEPEFGAFDLGGQAMFSQDGKKYASTCRSTNKVFLADFDRCTGVLSNGKALNVPNFSRHDPSDTTLQDIYTQGLCFSPNGQFLYVNKFFNLLQYDLTDPDSNTVWYHIAGLDTTWAAFQKYSSSYIGPDNKLYVGNWWGVSKQMSVINNPNVKGAGCNFCPRCLRFPYVGASSPPNMPNYDLGAELPCWPLENEEILMEQDELVVYPNPYTSEFRIHYKIETEGKIEWKLFDLVGKEIYNVQLNKNAEMVNISLPQLSSGTYYYQTKVGGISINTGKLIKY